MRDKVLGVIGGMGPLATDVFYKYVIENTQAECDQDHIDMVILSHASMLDRTRAIFEGKLDILFAELKNDLGILERAGAEYAIIPCNTCHVLLDQIKQLSHIEIINMIEETAKAVFEQFGRDARVGIMATDGTIKMRMYHDAILKYDMVPVELSEEMQKLNMSIIYDGVKSGKKINIEDFHKIEAELVKRKCCCAILGCTELSVVKDQYRLSDFFVDPMEIVARKVIPLCGGKLK